jgi:hypothetical protein
MLMIGKPWSTALAFGLDEHRPVELAGDRGLRAGGGDLGRSSRGAPAPSTWL